jgi:hypothetical protein
MSVYESVQRGPLKMKGNPLAVPAAIKKKKKKKRKILQEDDAAAAELHDRSTGFLWFFSSFIRD